MAGRTADIALRVTDIPPDHLIGRKLVDIPWSLYASADYLQRRGTPSDARDLTHHDVIGATGALARRERFAWLDRDFRGRLMCRSDDLMTMAAFALSGQGLALLPADVAVGLNRAGSLGPPGSNQLWLLTHPDLRNVARVRALMRFLTQAFRADPRFADPPPR